MQILADAHRTGVLWLESDSLGMIFRLNADVSKCTSKSCLGASGTHHSPHSGVKLPAVDTAHRLAAVPRKEALVGRACGIILGGPPHHRALQPHPVLLLGQRVLKLRRNKPLVA